MEITEILGLLFCHWIGDFVLQSNEVAKCKSNDSIALTSHCTSYLFAITIFIILFQVLPWHLERNFTQVQINTFIFLGLTFFSHWIQDYITSRINSYLYSKGQIHNFYVSLGFDQFLHFCQLILTYYFIFKI